MRASALAALVVLGLTIAGCGGLRPAQPRTGALATGPDLARASVLRGLQARGFTLEADNPGAAIAVLELPDVWLRIEVRYDGASYSIEYRESVGLEEVVGDDGVTRVSGLYRRYVDQLAVEIERAARYPDTILVYPPRTAGGETVATAPPATAPPTGTPPPAIVPTTPPPTTPAYGGATGTPVYGSTPAPIYGVAAAPPAEPPDTRPRRALHEVLIPGAIVWIGSWVANWGTTIGISNESTMIGMSFIPIIGPFVQLTQLSWRTELSPGYERWTGAFYPVMGLVQIAGLVLTVVGATVHVPTDGADAAMVTILPHAGPDGAGLDLTVQF